LGGGGVLEHARTHLVFAHAHQVLEATHRIVGPSDEHLVRVALEALEEAVLLVVPKELALHKLELGNLLLEAL